MNNSRKTRDMQLLQYEMLKELDRICEKYNITYSLAYGTLLGAVRHEGYIPWDTDTDVMVSIEDYDFLCEKLQYELNENLSVYYIKNFQQKGPLLARIGLKNESTKWMHLDLFPMVGAPKGKVKRLLFLLCAIINRKIYFFKQVNSSENYKNNTLKKIIANTLKILTLPISKKKLFKVDRKLKYKYNFSEANYLFNVYGSYMMKEFIPKSYLENYDKILFENDYFPVPKERDAYLTQMYGNYKVPKK